MTNDTIDTRTKAKTPMLILPSDRPRILVVAAHPDDAELGAGAATAKWVENGHQVTFLILTRGSNGPGSRGRRVQEQTDAAAELGVDVLWGDFEDGSVQHQHKPVLQYVESAIKELNVGLVLVHDSNDTHQDHRAAADAVLGASRRVGQVLQYESPSTFGFAPDIFVVVTQDHLDLKLKALSHHSSQVDSSAMVDADAAYGQARFRGFQSRAGTYAEGFRAIRLAL